MKKTRSEYTETAQGEANECLGKFHHNFVNGVCTRCKQSQKHKVFSTD